MTWDAMIAAELERPELRVRVHLCRHCDCGLWWARVGDDALALCSTLVEAADTARAWIAELRAHRPTDQAGG